MEHYEDKPPHRAFSLFIKQIVKDALYNIYLT